MSSSGSSSGQGVLQSAAAWIRDELPKEKDDRMKNVLDGLKTQLEETNKQLEKYKQEEAKQKARNAAQFYPANMEIPSCISLPIREVLITLGTTTTGYYSSKAWCDRFRFEELHVSYVAVLINGKQVMYFSPDPNEKDVYSFEILGKLLDIAPVILCYHQTYCFGILRQPYSLLLHNPMGDRTHLPAKIASITVPKPNYFNEQRMVYWRFRTISIFENIKEKVYRNTPFHQFFDLNDEWQCRKLSKDEAYLLTPSALAELYHTKRCSDLKNVLALHLQLQHHIFHLARQNPVPFFQYRKTQEEVARTRLVLT